MKMSTKSNINLCENIESEHMLQENPNKTEEHGSQKIEIFSDAQFSNGSNESISFNENLDCNFKNKPNPNFISENLDSALDSESNESDTTTSTDNRLSETITYQQKLLERNAETIKHLEEKMKELDNIKQELSIKLEQATKERDSAIKEKESIVIRYAFGEKNIIKERQQKEAAEKKYKELIRENEILQHKTQTMVSEKARICQMLDNKCYEFKTLQQEYDRTKSDLASLETKLKWSQKSLKNEIEAHKECQNRIETLMGTLKEKNDEIEQAKREAEDSIKSFQCSQDNKAHVLDQQVQEQQASLILLKHEKRAREEQLNNLKSELQRLQDKQKEMLQENNDLSLKVQQLERERLEMEHKLSELRGNADQHRQDVVDLQSKTVQLEQLKLQLKHEQDQLSASNEQMQLLKQRNSELESDMEACRVREAELLLFTQQLTDKNVRLQSEFTSMETKVQQITCEQNLLKRQAKEQQTKATMLSAKLSEEKLKYTEEIENLTKHLSEKTKLCDQYKQEVTDQKGENILTKRKFDMSLREINKELQHCRKKLEQYELSKNTTRSNSSNSLNTPTRSEEVEKVQVVQPHTEIDNQTLIEHIVKLQRTSAKKSEKIDFLEEHVNTLVNELQKKTKLLQSYILREQTGTMTSNKVDNNKAKLAGTTGVMASMYSSRKVDSNLTLELSLDINRKLQAVLEDVLLKNMTLKENVDTLGSEIDRLNLALKYSKT